MAPSVSANRIATQFRIRTGLSVQLQAIRDQLNDELTTMRIGYLLSLVEYIEDESKDNYNSLLELHGDAEVEEICIAFMRFRNDILSLREALTLRLPIPPPPPLVEQPVPIIQAPPQDAEIKLPQINIPKFDGSTQSWETFHDLFKAIVIENAKLNKVQKLWYLKSLLTDNAATLIQNLQITEGNFDEAWASIIARYDNKRKIVSAHFKRILDQTSLTLESHSELLKLVDMTKECVRALKVLGEPVESWSTPLLVIIHGKLDAETRKHWELSLPSNDMPKFTDFTKFLEQRAQALEASAGTVVEIPKVKKALVHHGNIKLKCPKCSKSHFLSKCFDFRKLSVTARVEFVKTNKLCMVCFAPNHVAKDCKREWNCRSCNSKDHNTMLHVDQGDSGNPAQNLVPRVMHVVNSNNVEIQQVLLATAIVYVSDGDGNLQKCRVLLDQGSECTLISEGCMSRLHLPRNNCNVEIAGVGGEHTVEKARGSTKFLMYSRDESFNCNVQAIVIRKVCNKLPRQKLDISSWSYLQGIHLADPEFHEPSNIDILLGADYIASLMLGGKIDEGFGMPIAQESKLGWILSGPISGNKICCNHAIRIHDSAFERQWAEHNGVKYVNFSRMVVSNDTRSRRKQSVHTVPKITWSFLSLFLQVLMCFLFQGVAVTMAYAFSGVHNVTAYSLAEWSGGSGTFDGLWITQEKSPSQFFGGAGY